MGYNSTNGNVDPQRNLEVGTKEVASMARTRTLFAFGINYKTAPVEIREKLHLRNDEIPAFLSKIRGELCECMVLSTCNRTEIYCVSDSPYIDLDAFKNALIDFKDARGLVQREHFFSLISCSASQQLFNVATSIDSKVIGDSQILRQLRTAYSLAHENGYTGKILNQLLQRAFRLGKMTYTETSIHDGAVSVSLAAVALGAETFGSLRERTALVIGAGEMARFTAEALINKRIGKILFANRAKGHAEELVSKLTEESAFEYEILDFENFKDRLKEADIIITSTGSDEPILYKEDFGTPDRKLLVVDIAVPRDVDIAVAEVPNVTLRNIDDLRSIIDGHQERRMNDLPKVRKLIANEMVDFLTWYYALPIMPSHEKTGSKLPVEQTREIVRVKEFVNNNLAEIHRLAAKSGGDFNEDLESHFSLIEKLRAIKAETFARSAV